MGIMHIPLVSVRCSRVLKNIQHSSWWVLMGPLQLDYEDWTRGCCLATQLCRQRSTLVEWECHPHILSQLISVTFQRTEKNRACRHWGLCVQAVRGLLLLLPGVMMTRACDIHQKSIQWFLLHVTKITTVLLMLHAQSSSRSLSN